MVLYGSASKPSIWNYQIGFLWLRTLITLALRSFRAGALKLTSTCHRASLLAFALAAVGCTSELAYSRFSMDPTVQRIVVVPDTQCYARYFPEILEAQGSWIVSEQQALDIEGVMHLGDIVDTNTEPEWQRARTVFSPVTTALPTILLPGNHDFGTGGSADARVSLMKDFFSASDRFVSREGGTFSDEGWNTWTIVTLGSSRWLLMGLEFAPRREVAQWAKETFDANDFDHAIVATHAYLASDGLRYGEPGVREQPFHPRDYGLFDEQSLDGQQLWKELIARSAKTRFVISGHVPRGFAHRRVQRANGQATIELLTDHQQGTICSEVGGDGRGFLHVLEITERTDSLDVRMVAYSPWLDAFAEEFGHKWTLRQ